MKFYYKAQGKTGVIIEETIEAETKDAVITRLRTSGATPIVIEKVRTKKKGEISLPPFLEKMLQSVSLKDKIMFSKNLSRMITAGLSISRSLEVLEKQSTNKFFQEILVGLDKEITTGGTLGSGLEKYPGVFSPLFVGMVRAGEESGALSENLIEVSKQLEKTYRLKKKIKGAMIYPSVIMTAMLIIGILMFVFVVPTLLATFEDLEVDLPPTTQMIVNFSDFIQGQPLLFIAIIFGVIGGVIGILKIKKLQPYIDYALIKTPAIGTIVREMNSALITRTLASLLSSGLSVNNALKMTKDVTQNVHYKRTIDDALNRISQGGQLSSIFQENDHLYPIMVGEMIEVGEETGKLSDMLRDVASFYEEEVNAKTKNLSTIIEPVLMLIIGAAVGFFAVSMMSPMYSVLSNVA